jgi:hypothetical protein
MRTKVLSFAVAVSMVALPSVAEDQPSDRPVRVELTPPPAPPKVTLTTDEPVTTKWYFWAGMGAATAVVAGVVAASLAIALTPRASGASVCSPGVCDACVNMGSCGGAPIGGG